MKIHFIGIGGIGVSALAQYYLAKGHKVSGSDLVRSEMTEFLREKGAKIYLGHNPSNLIRKSKVKSQKSKVQAKSQNYPDLVIYSPAISKDNPELKAAKKLKIKTLSYPQALGELTKKYFTIAVCGTHGKSTTAAMISLILIKAKLDPTVIIGTKLKEFGDSNFREGKSKYLIIEADEWKGAFLRYFPKIIVLTNIEKEHLDYYRDLNHILKTYQRFISHLGKKGVLIKNAKCKMKNEKLQCKVQNFSLKQKEVKTLKKILKVPGEHNILNALAALEVGRALKIPDKVSFRALSQYQGAWRRFEERELKIKNLKLKIISDYAHHPTEILATLKAAREKYPNKKIWCYFQPHQYQRTFYLFKEFVQVLKEVKKKAFVDKLILTDIYDVPGREKATLKKKINAKKLVKEVGLQDVVYIPKKKHFLLNFFYSNLYSSQIIIIMGAGDIYQIVSQIENSAN